MHIYLFDETPNRIATVNGKEYLFFSGYNYLGMHAVPEFAALVKEGINKYGWLFPSSRISNTRLKIFEEAEELLSRITGMEDTLLVSTGYTAGSIATDLFKNNIVNLEPSHPAITRTNNSPSENVFAVDSVGPLNASITDYSFITNNTTNKIIIIDDSHGIGLIGSNGEGISGRLPQNGQTKYILTYSFSKALHINAGAISCGKEIAMQLRTNHAYTSATAPSPALLHAFVNGQHLYELQRKKLRKNVQHFRSLIQDLSDIHFHAELPVFILPEYTDIEKLHNANIIISSFSYPDVNGKKINRVVLNALHTQEDLERLSACLHGIF
jgi:8-amino-7-oxononanoate synthase